MGDNCSIAANAVLLKPLEDNVTAVVEPRTAGEKDGVTIPKVKKSVSLRGYEVKDAGRSSWRSRWNAWSAFAARADTNQDKEREEATQ